MITHTCNLGNANDTRLFTRLLDLEGAEVPHRQEGLLRGEEGSRSVVISSIRIM